MGRPQDCSCQCCSRGDYLYIPVDGFGGVSLDRIEKRLRSTGALTNTWTQGDMDDIKSLDDVPYYYSGQLGGATLRKYNLFGFTDIEELWSYTEAEAGSGVRTYNHFQIAVDADYNVHYGCKLEGLVTENLNQRFRLRKLDEDGNSLWAYTLTPTGDDETNQMDYSPRGVAVSKNGNVFASGERNNSFTSGHIEVCLDSGGNVLWSDISTNVGTSEIDTSYEPFGGKVMFDEDENIYIATGVGLKSLDIEGNERYDETISPILNDYHVIGEHIYTIQDDDSNLNYVVTKRSASDPTSVLWTKEFPYVDSDWAAHIASDCNHVYFGYTYSESGTLKTKLYKLRASSGGEIWDGILSDNSEITGMLLEPGFPPVF